MKFLFLLPPSCLVLPVVVATDVRVWGLCEAKSLRGLGLETSDLPCSGMGVRFQSALAAVLFLAAPLIISVPVRLMVVLAVLVLRCVRGPCSASSSSSRRR